MLAILLALGSSLAWGLADFGAGLKSRRLGVLTVLFVLQAASLPMVATAVLLWGGPRPSGAGFAVLAVLAGVSGTVGIAAFYRGLVVGTMSVVAPISATAAVIPVTVGLAGGERPSLLQAVGVALAFVGVVLAAREPAGPSSPVPQARAAAGVGLALLAALGFGGFFVGIDAASARGGELWAILVQRTTSLVLVGGVALAVRPDVRRARPELLALTAIGFADLAANALFALASTRGLVAVVGVLGSLYPVVTIVLARTVLSERLAAPQWVGVGVALVGVGLITGA